MAHFQDLHTQTRIIALLFGPDTKAARDTNIMSVYTAYRNMTEVLVAVGCADNATDTYFTLEKPTVVKHILFANNTYNYPGYELWS